eukprot:TRINITY_DN65586_c0_g1_i1.p1 TRINITY_DN65586_c0_g1~~TRINITY_DN65586_c0_g1_i1.p1  ORF type:complete len:251 (+),score=23.07 TRINITY_DN65586_c0_g1_i1:46-753(+)
MALSVSEDPCRRPRPLVFLPRSDAAGAATLLTRSSQSDAPAQHQRDPLFRTTRHRFARDVRRDELMVACKSGDVGSVTALLAAGADARSSGKGGVTPLHVAVGVLDPHAAPAISQALLAARAAVDARDTGSNTPLHVCALNRVGGVRAGRVLLAFSADPLARNLQGDTPYDVAKMNGMLDFCALVDGFTATDLRFLHVSHLQDRMIVPVGKEVPGAALFRHPNLGGITPRTSPLR